MVKELLLYKNIFENAKEGFFLTDNKGIIELANPMMVHMFGYTSSEELVGEAIEIFLPKSKAKSHVKLRNEHIKNPMNRPIGAGKSLEAMRKDGSLFFVEVSLSHFKTEKDELKILGFVVDVTLRKKAEDQIKSINADLETKVKARTCQLEEAVEKGNELNNLKTRFVSMVSHEFRTPLSSIHSSATLLSKYKLSDEQERRDKHIARIKKSVNNLTDILSDILTLNKVEEGKLPVNIEKLNIKNLFEESCEELQAIAIRGQTINYIHSGKEIFSSDLKLLRNISNNLISNAIKYSHPKGRIEVTTKFSNSILSISVKDYGIGIPLKEQVRLFERFFRAANVTNIQGTGLGLNIVKKYTELLDGRIFFKSKQDIETEFTVEIPERLILKN